MSASVDRGSEARSLVVGRFQVLDEGVQAFVFSGLEESYDDVVFHQRYWLTVTALETLGNPDLIRVKFSNGRKGLTLVKAQQANTFMICL